MPLRHYTLTEINHLPNYNGAIYMVQFDTTGHYDYITVATTTDRDTVIELSLHMLNKFKAGVAITAIWPDADPHSNVNNYISLF